MQTRAAVLTEPNEPFRIIKIEIGEPRDDEVLVRIDAVGICHTDLVFASGAMPTPFPLILGHEGAGVVERVGRDIVDLEAGDKVLLTFDSCGHCPKCREERPAYCHEFVPLNFAGVRADGSSPASFNGAQVSARFFGQSSFARHCITHRRNVVKLAPNADTVKLAPLGCGVQTGVGGVMRSLGAKPGSSIAILGGGAVGLSAVIGAKIAECALIILIEPKPERRQLGVELGAHHVIDPNGINTAEVVRAIKPDGVDYVLDTSGVVGAMQAATGMLGFAGVMGLVGVPGAMDAALALPVVPAITYGWTVKGIIEGDSDPQSFLPQLINLYHAGDLPIDRFVRTYPFADINKAIADSHSGACVKAVLTLGDV